MTSDVHDASTDEWGTYLSSQKHSMDPLKPCGVSIQYRRRSWAYGMRENEVDFLPLPNEITGWEQDEVTTSSDTFPRFSISSINEANHTKKSGQLSYRTSDSPASMDSESYNNSPAQGLWEDDFLRRRSSFGIKNTSNNKNRRMSCDAFCSTEELEASRMRIRQAAWEVVNAQQQLDAAAQITQTPTKQKSKSKMYTLRKWFTPWKSFSRK